MIQTLREFARASFIFLILSFSIISCTTSSKLSESNSVKPNSAVQIHTQHVDPEIHSEQIGSYTSSGPGFNTISYWINGPEGLILIDTQFLLSATEEFVNTAERLTGKKAVLAIVLHPNPDKFNGTALLQKRGIHVITSEQVAQKIPAVHMLRLKWFYEDFKPDYPLELPQPESFGSETREYKAAGLKFKLHVLGAGCSESHVVVEWQNQIFVGDLITQGYHSWLELGLLDQWLQRLDELANLQPATVYTGRGGWGSAALIDNEKKYLTDVISVIRKQQKQSSRMTESVENQITEKILALYPAYKYSRFVTNGLENSWQHLKNAKQSKK